MKIGSLVLFFHGKSCFCGAPIFPLARCDGATSIITFQMAVIHVLTLSEMHPDAVTTAYGPLADFITIGKHA